MITDLELHSLQIRRRDQRLQLLFRVVEGSVPTIPPHKFLHSPKTNKRRVQPKRFTDCVTIRIIGRPLQCLQPTQTIRNSYYVKTIVEWNKLSEPQVRAGTIGEFSRLSCGLHSQYASCALMPSYIQPTLAPYDIPEI